MKARPSQDKMFLSSHGHSAIQIGRPRTKLLKAKLAHRGHSGEMHGFWACRNIAGHRRWPMPLLSGAALCRICNPETNFTFPENSDPTGCLNPTGQGHSPRPDFCTPQVSLRFPSDSLSLRECHRPTRASRSPAVALMSRKHRTHPDQGPLSALLLPTCPFLCCSRAGSGIFC